MNDIDTDLKLPISFKCGAIVGWFHVSPGLDLAKLTIHQDKIVLEVNWIFKIRKYELAKSEIVKVENNPSIFGTWEMKFKHDTNTVPRRIAVRLWDKDIEISRKALLMAGYKL